MFENCSVEKNGCKRMRPNSDDFVISGEKPFSCPHCSRAFADRSNLRAHLQTHSEIKKYQCRSCFKTFSRISLLTKHEEAGCCPMSWYHKQSRSSAWTDRPLDSRVWNADRYSVALWMLCESGLTNFSVVLISTCDDFSGYGFVMEKFLSN